MTRTAEALLVPAHVAPAANQPLDQLRFALKHKGSICQILAQALRQIPETVLLRRVPTTPVVAFDIGGLPEMVEHRRNGWLAPPLDTQARADGIGWVLQDDTRCAVLSVVARAGHESAFSPRAS